jgi:hypothetical protein
LHQCPCTCGVLPRESIENVGGIVEQRLLSTVSLVHIISPISLRIWRLRALQFHERTPQQRHNKKTLLELFKVHLLFH